MKPPPEGPSRLAVVSLAPSPVVAGELDAESLFRGRREIVIAHAGQRYRLRITQNGKLILTK